MEALSLPSKLPMEGDEVRGLLTQQPFALRGAPLEDRDPPCGAGLPAGRQPACYPHSSAVLRQERDRSRHGHALVQPGLQLPGSAVSLLPPTLLPPPGERLEKRSRRPTVGPSYRLAHALPQRREVSERFLFLVGPSPLKHPTCGRPFRRWWVVG